VNHIERRTKAVTLILIVASAALFAALATTAFGQDANSTTTDTTGTTTSTATTTTSTASDIPFWGFGMMTGEQGFERGLGEFGSHGRGFGSMGNIEISSAYNQTVTNILGNDSDVQNLIAQGYNVTSIIPVVKNVIGADGTITSSATTAVVTLQNGTTGRATVTVDITNAKVTQIVTLTRTVIDKSTS
jgi:hypothetical protein